MKRNIILRGDVAYVPLTKGYVATIDAADAHIAEGGAWQALVCRKPDGSVRTVYAQRKQNGKSFFLHRSVMFAPKGVDVDHVDGNGLDCRKVNLRLATAAQNTQNQRVKISNTSGAKGVTWHSKSGKWMARITANRDRRYLGCFDSLEEAAKAYASASAELHGAFGRPS